MSVGKMNVRYFVVTNDEGERLQVVKLYEFDGDTSEQREMRAAFNGAGLQVSEIVKEEFYYILASNVVTNIEAFNGPPARWKGPEVAEASSGEAVGYYDAGMRFHRYKEDEEGEGE